LHDVFNVTSIGQSVLDERRQSTFVTSDKELPSPGISSTHLFNEQAIGIRFWECHL